MSCASEAYGILHNALTQTVAACAEIDLFTADALTSADKAVLKGLCDKCPLAEPCRAYAITARPTAGFWAGKTHGTRPPKTDPPIKGKN